MNRLRRHPRVVKQWTIFQIVIGMVMRNEDVAHPIQRHACFCQLSRNAIATIDYVRNIVDENERRRTTAPGPGAKRRSAFCAEQDDSSSILILASSDSGKEIRGEGETRSADEKLSAIRSSSHSRTSIHPGCGWPII